MAGGWLDAAASLAGSAPALASQFMPAEQADVSSVSGVSDLCFKCFIWLLQK